MTADAGSELRAGAGSASIIFPPAVWPIDGFGGQRDPLYVRTLLVEAEGERAVLVILDQTSLAPEPLASVRSLIANELGLGEDRLLVGVSHTFSAPHLAQLEGLDESALVRMALAREAVLTAATRSARQALASLRQATLMIAEGQCDINVNRDIETPNGWDLGHNSDAFSDKSLQLLRLVDSHGADIAVLANYAVQPSVMNGSRDAGGMLVASADLAGVAVRQVENSLPGSVAFFLIGASGDQAPALTGGIEVGAACDLLGARLGAAIVHGAGAARISPPAPLRLVARSVMLDGQKPVERSAFRPTRSHEFHPAAQRGLPFWILTLGQVAIVAVQVELSAESGARLREASPFPTTLIVTMVNGGDKYLPDASSFDRMTYEALSSRYARGGAEVLETALLEELRELASQQN